MQPFILTVAKREKYIDYKGVEPQAIVRRHYEYILHLKRVHAKTDTSLYTEVKMMAYFFKFLLYKEVKDLSRFSYPLVQELYAFLATTLTKANKPLSQSSQRLVYTFFKSFSKWLYNYYPYESPSLQIFIKSNFKRNNDTLKTAVISDYVLKQIRNALRVEKDVYAKAYITVLFYYGLCSSDIVSLKEDCLKQSAQDNKYDLYYVNHKSKEAVIVPAIEFPVYKALSLLITHTEVLRLKSSYKEIFIKENKQKEVKLFFAYQADLLNWFVKKHTIHYENKAPVHLTSNMFRRTLATNLQSSGAPIETTQVMLNHKYKRTTMQYYIKTKEEEYITEVSRLLEHMNILSNTNDILLLNSDYSEKQSLRLADGYCLNTTMTSDKEYICDTFKKQGNCYGCTKMITTPEFLPYFKELYSQKEDEIQRESVYGNSLLQHLEFEKELVGALIEKLESFGEKR
ncbi:tyrosine-type recombinase/integrase (plasmid) [Sulfurimonas aquatica]|uniref:Tyrosine-type recombinase/integrase n=1 Tax=Sulfurimonas aquatica TaxID=2672570 RepID=A0A975GE14_9BACT|nr:tyrosine-type recombinase/integrase [Sulfurimonas aquatica]QSZ43192.1 tyrosine-type recombinase/integrase [Sulfurimonas aquatica]